MTERNNISIIVPIYNSEKYLNKCLNSLGEKKKSDEIILINDGSTDESEKICKEFKRKYENVVIISQKNSGVSVARNVGISEAKNDWIIFVDSDDYLLSGWRSIITEAISNNLNSDIIIFSKGIKDKKCTQKECIEAALGFGNSIGYSLGFVVSKLFKRKIITDNGIMFSNKLINGEDVIFNSQVYSCSTEIIGVAKPIYAYYKNMASATNRFDYKIIETEHVFHEEIRNFFIEHDLMNAEWNKIYEITLLTGIYAIMYRIALSNDLKNNKSIIPQIIKEEEYKNALTKLTEYKDKISKIKIPVLYFIKYGHISMAFYITKMICIAKGIRYKKWREDNGVLATI